MRKVISSFTALIFAIFGVIVPVTSATGANGPMPAMPQTNDRIVFEDDFTGNDGANWIATAANQATQILFEQNMVTVKGGGPENRILSKDSILADTFTMDMDVFIGAEHTNAALKFGFLSNADATSRYQVTWDGPNKLLKLERVESGATTVLARAQDVDMPVNMGGEPHEVSVTVENDRVTASINGVEYIDAEVVGIQDVPQGRILVASQFPKQHYAIDHVRVSTKEAEPTGEYELTLKTQTDGQIDTSPDTAGGVLTANRMSGDDGDEVTLSYQVKPGYVFDGYDSFVTETGTSTDGLLTIKDNRFSFNDKTGSVTVVAKFITEPYDPNILFKDYFEGALNDHGEYTFSDTEQAVIEDGELLLNVGSTPSSVIVDNSEWGDPKNYQIEMDIRKANPVAGTVQVAFRMGDLSDRYVVALNGSKAMIRKLGADGTNVELASTPYSFDQTARKLVIDVEDNVVSVSANNKPILSYENQDSDVDSANWSGLKPALSIINMTEGATVGIDNIRVVRNPVYVTASVEVTNDGAEDPDRVSGAVTLDSYRVASGQTLQMEAFPKGGFELDSISYLGEPIEGNEFTVPSGLEEDFVLVANFVPKTQEAKTYYIDSADGDDAKSGTSPAEAWKSFENLNRTFNPGDSILLKRGSEFSGEDALLAFGGSGTATDRITVSDYGEGPLPKLNGQGEVENVVSLYNQQYITIENLDIANTHPDYSDSFGLNTSNNASVNLRAVNVSARDFGVVNGITLQDLYIHDINGNLRAKWNGGIFFDVVADINDGELYGTPTKYDDVLIANNTLERVDRSGIKLVSSHWANQSLENAPNVPMHWYPSTNVVVRDNVLRYMGGDAITVRDTDGALVEYNLARHSRYQNTGYNAGIWPFEATNTVVQYNEVSNTHGVQDGQGFDCDHVSSYSVMQYNYSHDNEGGFMLVMNGFPHTAPTIRYNISQNDADKTFEFARGTAAGTMIYNNTIYSDVALTGRGGVLDLANWKAGTGNRDIYLFNNIFHYPEGQTFYVGDPQEMKTKAKLINNAYFGGITPPEEEENAITADPQLPAVGSAPVDNAEAVAPKAGRNVEDHFDGYIPAEESPLHNAGMSVDEVVKHYGGATTDRRDMAPDALHKLTGNGESIDFVAGEYLPDVDGVTYDRDFLGTKLPEGKTNFRSSVDVNPGLTIGAIQGTTQSEEPSEDPTEEPSEDPSDDPSEDPSEDPSVGPSEDPTEEVTEESETDPGAQPTMENSTAESDLVDTADPQADSDAADRSLPVTGSGNVGILALAGLLLFVAGGLMVAVRKNS